MYTTSWARLDSRKLDELREKLDALPRFPMVQRPTPLHEVARLSERLDGPRIFVKREDLSGLALGGNKTRELDYFLGAAIADEADVFIAGGGVAQSNHAVQCSAAARKAGLRPVVVLRPFRADPTVGNHLLHLLIGTDVRITEPTQPGHSEHPRFLLAQDMDKVADEYRSQGCRPWVLHSSFHPLGVVGFVDGALELTDQIRDAGIDPTHIYVTSSGATQAGLVLGNKFLGTDVRVVGVHSGETPPGHGSMVTNLANDAASLLDIPTRLDEGDVVSAAFQGEGYGYMSAAGLEAMRLLAETEGIFVDPVYTSKGLAGLISHIREGRIGKGETVIFVHTGGVGVMSAYGKEIAATDAALSG